MHCNNLRLVLGLVRVSSRVRIRVKVRVSVLVRVSIRTSWLGGELHPISLLPASNLHSSHSDVPDSYFSDSEHVMGNFSGICEN